MSAKLHLPRSLANMANGNIDLDVDGGTVRECLKQVVDRVPRIMPELFYGTSGSSLSEGAKLRSVVAVAINRRKVSSDILEWKVRDGDDIQIKLHLG